MVSGMCSAEGELSSELQRKETERDRMERDHRVDYANFVKQIEDLYKAMPPADTGTQEGMLLNNVRKTMGAASEKVRKQLEAAQKQIDSLKAKEHAECDDCKNMKAARAKLTTEIAALKQQLTRIYFIATLSCDNVS